MILKKFSLTLIVINSLIEYSFSSYRSDSIFDDNNNKWMISLKKIDQTIESVIEGGIKRSYKGETI